MPKNTGVNRRAGKCPGCGKFCRTYRSTEILDEPVWLPYEEKFGKVVTFIRSVCCDEEINHG